MSADSAYYVANINYGSYPKPLPEKQVLEFLFQAESNMNNISFQWVRIHQPQAGACFLAIVPQNITDVPDDGFVWQDVEYVKRLMLPGSTQGLEIFSRDRGFKAGDQIITMQKRRYRLIGGQSQLQFIHYMPADPSNQQRVQPMKKQPTRTYQKRVVSGAADADSFKFVGDELDAVTLRDLAMVRYKRNHQLLADLFSPASVSDLIKDGKNALFGKDPKSLAEAQKAKKEQLDAEIEKLENEHKEKLKQIRESAKVIYHALSSVPQLQTSADCDQSMHELANTLNMKVIPSAPVIRLFKKVDPNNAVPDGQEQDNNMLNMNMDEIIA